MQTLNVNPDTIRFLINKAHEFHVKEQVTIPEEPLNPADDWATQVLADHNDDPSYLELKNTINDLEPDQQIELVALMWLGRGDFDAQEWEDAVAQARDNWNERTADYVIATPLMADYLAEALNMLEIDIE